MEVEYKLKSLDFLGFPDYKADSDGNIWSNRKGKWEIMKGGLLTYYRVVFLTNKDGMKSFHIHILVAKCFIKNHIESNVIDHIDRNPLNNRLNNLRSVSKSENSLNTIRQQSQHHERSCKFKGVYYDIECQKWRIKITINQKSQVRDPSRATRI